MKYLLLHFHLKALIIMFNLTKDLVHLPSQVVTPSPVNPPLQLHINEPSVFVHTPNVWSQLPKTGSHSLISVISKNHTSILLQMLQFDWLLYSLSIFLDR